jgi:hypothetical protein
MELSIVNEAGWLSVLLCYTLYPTLVGSGPVHAIRYAIRRRYPFFSSHALFLFYSSLQKGAESTHATRKPQPRVRPSRLGTADSAQRIFCPPQPLSLSPVSIYIRYNV